jgi:DNA topoisomerase-1
MPATKIIQAAPPPTTDPAAIARSAGLRYTADNMPGIRRVRSGKGFRYFGPRGRPIRDPAEIGRIKSLVIPPAWTDVWICPHPDGHLQATGRDARGRKQFLYHPQWRQVRDCNKYDRIIGLHSSCR